MTKSERTWMLITEWLNKLGLIHSVGCYAPIKKNKLRISVVLDRGPGCIIKNEDQDEKKGSYFDLLFAKTTVDTPKKVWIRKDKGVDMKLLIMVTLRTGELLIFFFIYFCTEEKDANFKTKWKFGNTEQIKEKD